MTLSYTQRLHLAVPDFLSEPWHQEFATAMDSIDSIIYNVLIAQNTDLWHNSTVYAVGDLVISPDTGGLFSCAVANTSSPAPTTFTQELIAHPTFWTSLVITLATQAEAEAGVENTHYMSPLRTAQAIAAQTTTPVVTLPQVPPQGRLTLTSGAPVMTASVSGGTTIYYTPYKGNQIPIFDGSNMIMTPFSEINTTTTDTTQNPAIIGADKVNDWFVWVTGGVVKLTHGPDWTDLVTRSAGTSLTRVKGLLVNAQDITNGPAATFGMYVGTTRSDGTSKLNWVYGGAASGGSAGLFNLWNNYNRVLVISANNDTVANWAYAGGAGIRPLDGAGVGSGLNNRFSAVFGLQEEPVLIELNISTAHSAGQASVGIGLDVTNAFSFVCGNGNVAMGPVAVLGFFNVIGSHFFQALEASTAANATYWGSTGSTKESFQFKAWM